MFKSLHHILDVIENQPGWETQQQFRLIRAQWSGVVGVTVAAHTRPTAIDRSVLWVATSSPIWAQELTFKRHLILAKLNEKLPSLKRDSIDTQASQLTNLKSDIKFPIKDIRFSPGQWQPRFDDASPVPANHPSYLAPKVNPKVNQITVNQTTDTSPPIPNMVNAPAWWQQVQARSSHLPLCCQCQCPTPPGEIDRWGCCALCATKKWSR